MSSAATSARARSFTPKATSQLAVRCANACSRWSVARTYATALLGAGVVGWIDYVTGIELRVFPLYFLPTSLVAWRAGAAPGLLASLTCALVWESSNDLAGIRYTDASISYANTGVLFVAFALVSALVSGLRAEIERERALARIDGLTGLLNSRAFRESSELELARARRHGHPLALAFLDLDGFKRVNDTHGHETGDALLQAAARTMREALRATDIIARVGGDEFVVLLPETGADAAVAAVRKVHERLHADAQFRALGVTASAGIVSYARPPLDLAEMMRRADALMYASKQRARGQIQSAIADEPLGHDPA